MLHKITYHLAVMMSLNRKGYGIRTLVPILLFLFIFSLFGGSAAGQESLREYIYRDGELIAIDNVNLSSSCVYDLSATNVQVLKTATTNNTVGITSGTGCNWTASKNGSWITLTGSTSGSGNGTVSYNIGANTGPARTGSITVAGKTLHIYQASACTYSLSPSGVQLDGFGGSGSISVTCGTGCPWNASKTASWISFTGSTSGSGNGSVGYSVGTNDSGEMRLGAILIGGQQFGIVQLPNCDMTCWTNCMYLFGDPEFCGMSCGCSF